jgi:hypothetical protein
MLSSATQMRSTRIPRTKGFRLKWRSSLNFRQGRSLQMASAAEKPTMEQRILETADRLFYLQGIRAVGVDTIAAETGISKRTLYNHFPSKDALIAAYLERRFTRAPPSDKPPVEQILGTFDRLERGFASKGFRGCPFVNAVAELGAAPRIARSGRSRSPSRKAAACGFAICCCSSVSPTRKASRRSSRCWSTVRSRRTWCGTIRQWPAPQRTPRGCCWRMRASMLVRRMRQGNRRAA